MPFAYGAAGLTLVADRGLHGFPALPSSSSADADLRVQVGRSPAWASLPGTPFYTSPYSDPRGIPVVQVTRTRAGFAFAYADGTRFWIDEDGTHIWMTSERTDEDACTYLAGPVLAFALRLRGEFSSSRAPRLRCWSCHSSCWPLSRLASPHFPIPPSSE